MNFFQKFRDFIAQPSHSRTMGLLIVLILITAVSLTVIVAQQQQQLRQRASGACVKIDDIDSIQECSPDISTGDTCTAEGDRCRIGSLIHECKEE